MRCLTLLKFGVCTALLVAFNPVFSAPLGYEGSVMTMLDITPDWRQFSANYAITAQDAIGVSTAWMRPMSGDTHHQFQANALEYTRLMKRWNLDDAQANVFGVIGVGNMKDTTEGGYRGLWTYGLQADYETTRLYGALKTRWYQTKHAKSGFSSLALGASFYEVDEPTEIQPWFVFEGQRTNGIRNEWEWTPMLRFIHQQFFIEAGVSHRGAMRLSTMFVF